MKGSEKCYVKVFETQNNKIGELIGIINQVISENASMRNQMAYKPKLLEGRAGPFEKFREMVEKANSELREERAYKPPVSKLSID
jgi:hypothetical protein